MIQNYLWLLQLTLSILLLTLVPVAHAQTLTNRGVITVENGATLFVEGIFLNTAEGSLINDGTVQLTGDFTNNDLKNVKGVGLWRFSGSQKQTLTSPAGTVLTNLIVDNSGATDNNQLSVPADLTIAELLTLNKGLVRTNATSSITLLNAAAVSGEDAGRYVQGNLRILRTNVAGVMNFGNGLVLDGTGQNLGSVSVTRTAGLKTLDVSYGANVGASTKGIDCIWTVVTTSQPTSPIPVTLTWLADNNNGLQDFTQASMWQRATVNDSWMKVGEPVNAVTRSLTKSIAILNSFTVSNAGNPLPVQLSHFSAEHLNDDALLKWGTASEVRSAYFTVEASTDGIIFQKIGKVASQGTSSIPHEYQLRDPAVSRYGVSLIYYRLRQVDTDGIESFSPVRTVRLASLAKLEASAWPIPFTTRGLTLKVQAVHAGPANVLLHDALGRTLVNHSLTLVSGTNSLVLPELGKLAAGVYNLSIVQGGSQTRLKVIRE
ncbi:T9SS type A sorting domain-containing protein [Hymenobacter sp. HD11105]